jgi:hypothetical protein
MTDDAASTASPFSRIDPELLPIFEELRPREPIFHCKELGVTSGDFATAMAADFWEVGASGRRYSRAFILAHAGQIASVNAEEAGWQASGFGLRRLEAHTYLLTYTLRQTDRLTRRSTIWQRTPEGWRILYHQGTMVAAEEDDVLPG